MPRRLANAVIVLTSASALLLGVTANTATAGASTRHGLTTAATNSLPRGLTGAQQSGNWAGYVVTPKGGDVTSVTSSFVVPAAGDVLPGISSTWAGIGGDSTPDLIQAGVGESSFPSLPVLGDQYYAWYELLPGSIINLTGCSGNPSCAVVPGDRVSVHIVQTSTDVWTISMTDGTKWSWSLTGIKYASQHSSAEWIYETPTFLVLPLIPAGVVGGVHFGPTSTFTVGAGAPQTIAEGDGSALDMSLLGLGLFNEATPSALAPDGQSFTVCTYTNTCGAPA